MPRIRCHFDDCAFLKHKHCTAAAVELDPDSGCLTYTITDVEDIVAIEETEDWDDLLDDEEEDDSLYEDDDEPFDDWDDDDDDDF